MQNELAQEWAATALAAAKTAGADHAEVRVVEELAESIDVRDDRVEGVSRTSSRGVGVRVLAHGAWGFAATNDPAGLRAAAERAVEIARASAPLRGDPVVLDDTPPPAGTYTTPHERNPFDVPLAEKIDLLLATAAAGRAADGIAYVEATTDAWQRTTIYRASDGGWFDQTVVQVGGGLRGTALGEGELQRRSWPNSFRGQFTCGGWEDVTGLDLPGHALGTCREAVALLTAPELPQRDDTTLLIESSQLALQVHESVGHPTELDRILGMERAYAGTSWVAVEDRGTLRYGSPLVTILADATTPGALGTFGYDDEGVPAGSAPIVVGGVLEGFLTSRETAGLLGERSNGTARADSWNAIPLIRMNNVSLQPGDTSFDDLVADTDDGVLLATNRSWSIDDKRLNFQFGCEAAYAIRHGRVGRLYRNPTYGGRTPVFWGGCDALGSDWKVWGVPNCGKGQPSQTARVAHGAPTGRFRNVTTGARP